MTNHGSNEASVVPEWKDRYPVLESASEHQKRFYDYWLRRFETGDPVDVGESLSYIRVYLSRAVNEFLETEHLDCVLGRFNRITTAYGNIEEVRLGIECWSADAYLYLDRYDEAWEAMRARGVGVDDLMNIRTRCSDTWLDGWDLLKLQIPGKNLTRMVRNDSDEVAHLAGLFLLDFQNEHGKNLVDYFFRQFDLWNPTEINLSLLEDFFPMRDEFLACREQHQKDTRRGYGRGFFPGHPCLAKRRTVEWIRVPEIVYKAFSYVVKGILRESENTIREDLGIANVGEKWRGEAELFHKLRELFPSEKILFHARPRWLGPQHLDIYFPRRNIACEYQGPQHDEPLRFFGGENGLKAQRSRDERKRLLCEKNGCKILYLQEGYDMAALLQSIRFALDEGISS